MRIIYGYRRDHGSYYRRPVYLEGPWWRVTAYRVVRWLFYRAMAAEQRAMRWLAWQEEEVPVDLLTRAERAYTRTLVAEAGDTNAQ